MGRVVFDTWVVNVTSLSRLVLPVAISFEFNWCVKAISLAEEE